MNLEKLAQNLPKWMTITHHVFGGTPMLLIETPSSLKRVCGETCIAFELFSHMQKVCAERGWRIDGSADVDGVWFTLYTEYNRPKIATQPTLVQAIIELASVFPWEEK